MTKFTYLTNYSRKL